jgi:hypothetical protein
MNPWPWILALLFIIGGFLSGYRIGAKATAGEYERAAGQAMTAMIDRHNELAKEDAGAAAAAEKRRQERRIRQMEVQHELELEAMRNHRPECTWTERERGLLNDLIDSANGGAHAAGGVSDGLRPPPAAAGGNGRGGEGLGRARRGKLWRMSVEAR